MVALVLKSSTHFNANWLTRQKAMAGFGIVMHPVGGRLLPEGWVRLPDMARRRPTQRLHQVPARGSAGGLVTAPADNDAGAFAPTGRMGTTGECIMFYQVAHGALVYLPFCRR